MLIDILPVPKANKIFHIKYLYTVQIQAKINDFWEITEQFKSNLLKKIVYGGKGINFTFKGNVLTAMLLYHYSFVEIYDFIVMNLKI